MLGVGVPMEYAFGGIWSGTPVPGVAALLQLSEGISFMSFLVLENFGGDEEGGECLEGKDEGM